MQIKNSIILIKKFNWLDTQPQMKRGYRKHAAPTKVDVAIME